MKRLTEILYWSVGLWFKLISCAFAALHVPSNCTFVVIQQEIWASRSQQSCWCPTSLFLCVRKSQSHWKALKTFKINIIYSFLSQLQYKIFKTSELYNKYKWIDDQLFYSIAYYLQSGSSCPPKDNNGLIFWSPAQISAAIRKHSACSLVTGTVDEKRRGKN